MSPLDKILTAPSFVFLFPDVCAGGGGRWPHEVLVNVTQCHIIRERILAAAKYPNNLPNHPLSLQSQEITFAALSPISQNGLDRAASPQSEPVVVVICQFSGLSRSGP